MVTKLLTRLRVEFSDLRYHKFRHSFNCFNLSCLCLTGIDDNEHFVLHCPCFAMQHKDLDLVSSLSNIEIMCLSSKDLSKLLLYGHPNFTLVINRVIVESPIKSIKPTNLGNEHSFICNQCLKNENDISQNAWNLFPFANDFFCNNTGALPVENTVDDLDEVLSKDKWNIFNKRGLQMIHLNINSVLSKIEELRVVARKSKAAVIGVTESKLDATVLDGEVNIDGYEVIRSDRNRHGGGVACYVRNDISFNVRSDFSDEIENIVFDMLLPKTKPILVGILYRPPDQSKFLDKLSTAISKATPLTIRKLIF